jgi:hypothetical protein
MENFANATRIPEDIGIKIVTHLKNDDIVLAHVLLFLVENPKGPKFISKLNSANNEELLTLIDELVEQIKKKRSRRFCNVFFCLLFSNFMRVDKELLLKILTNFNQIQEKFSLLPPPMHPAINFSVELFIVFNDDVTKHCGGRYEVLASLIYFLWDFFWIMKSLSTLEITGTYCAKKIIVSFVLLGTTVTGGYVGEIVGSSVSPGFPLVAIAGALVMGSGSFAITSHLLSNQIIQ